MADAVDQLTADFAAYRTAVEDSFTKVGAALADLEATVTALKAEQDAAGATPARIASLDTQITQAKDSVAKAMAAILPPAAPPAAAPPAAAPPSAPAGTAAPPPVTGDPGTAPPAEASAANVGAPPPTSILGQPLPAAPVRSAYTFDGADDSRGIDHNQWPDAHATSDGVPPQKLYYFSGDVAPGDAKGDGVGGVWHLYTGTRVPA